MNQDIKIVICWSDISGYMAACWQSLQNQQNVSLKLFAFKQSQETEFNKKLMGTLDVTWLPRDPRLDQIENGIIDFNPDVIIICGWFIPAYRQLVSHKGLSASKKILAMDTPWWGTTRQQIGQLLLRKLIKKFDGIITSGERSYQYARRLGGKNIAKIQYGVDFEGLSKNLEARTTKPWPRSFLFIGRYAEEKGLNILTTAYKRYLSKSTDKWSLQVCGKGPLEGHFKDTSIINHGFVQPSEMSEIWSNAGCLILPSNFDPWPLIVVEACAAGLPVICTHESGSQVEVVKVYWNGLVIPANNSKSLIEAMEWMEANYDSLPTFGQRSQAQAAPYSAVIWSEKILHFLNTLH